MNTWFQWFLSDPNSQTRMLIHVAWARIGIRYSNTNAFLFDNRNTLVYFTTASPFQKPDFRRVVMTRNAPLLVPVYNVVVSPALYTMKTEEEYVVLSQEGLRGNYARYGCSEI